MVSSPRVKSDSVGMDAYWLPVPIRTVGLITALLCTTLADDPKLITVIPGADDRSRIGLLCVPCKVRVPFTVMLLPEASVNVLPLLLFNVRLLKTVVPEMAMGPCVHPSLKTTVLSFAEKLPRFTQFPLTLMVPVPAVETACWTDAHARRIAHGASTQAEASLYCQLGAG